MARIVTIGAGIAGVLASRDLVDAAHEVVVLDKGYTPGGRMATRHLGGATFDHGAQFLTAKDERFARLVSACREDGIVAPWFVGAPDVDAPPGVDGHPRFRGATGMRPLVQRLAGALDVRTQQRVTQLQPVGSGWLVAVDGSEPLEADAVVCTAPVPQALALLDAGGAALPTAATDVLGAIAYAPCIAVLAVPDSEPTLPNDGALRLAGEPIEWLADNRAKGISDRPAVTIHAGPRTSDERWDEPDDVVGAALCRAAERHLGTTSAPVRVHRWRYSRPTSPPVQGEHLLVTSPAPLALAGDGFAGGRVEGAARSGWAAAVALSRTLGPAG